MNANVEEPDRSSAATPPAAVPGRTDGVALAALVVGVGAVLASVIGVGIFFGVAAVVLGVAARGRAHRSGRSTTLATAGVILGVAGAVIGAGVVAVFLFGGDRDPVAATVRPRTAAAVDDVVLTRCEIGSDGRALATGAFRDPTAAGGELQSVRVVFVRDDTVVGTAVDRVELDDGGNGEFRVETRVDGADPVTCAVDDISRE